MFQCIPTKHFSIPSTFQLRLIKNDFYVLKKKKNTVPQFWRLRYFLEYPQQKRSGFPWYKTIRYSACRLLRRSLVSDNGVANNYCCTIDIEKRANGSRTRQPCIFSMDIRRVFSRQSHWWREMSQKGDGMKVVYRNAFFVRVNLRETESDEGGTSLSVSLLSSATFIHAPAKWSPLEENSFVCDTVARLRTSDPVTRDN